jgi:hypothetical protein
LASGQTSADRWIKQAPDEKVRGCKVYKRSALKANAPKGGELEAVHLNLLFAQHPQRAVEATPLRNLKKRVCPKFAMALWLVIIFPIDIAKQLNTGGSYPTYPLF